MKKLITFSTVLLLAAVIAPFSAGQALEPLEEAGIDLPAPAQAHFMVDKQTLNNAARSTGFLLIPDSTTDTVGMFDPMDGTYLGDLINGAGMFSTPICAMLGPDGDIYVSDQVADSVFVYNLDGNYLYTYCDASDGLNNIRGIDFRGGHLFVTSGDDYVAEFDAPHSRLPDFINDGSDSFDILFLSDGTSLLCDILSDTMRHYDINGNLMATLFSVDFPEQVQFDSLTPGDYLVNSFSDLVIHDFELNGTIVQSTPLPTYGRGVYRLGNGNLLATDGTGVHELQPGTGVNLGTKYYGQSRFVEFIPPAGGEPLTADTDSVSKSTGGVVNFTLAAGSGNAGRTYYLVATKSGTSPGTLLPGGLATIPINRDAVTDYILRNFGSPMLVDFKGNLDGNGDAAAQLNVPGLPSQIPVGTVLHFAYALTTPWDFASNAVAIDVLP